jgi:2-succinyl-5-enolpyruvyl-6-hydroxy-3-cyclohexene-1-carboxylate synthase
VLNHADHLVRPGAWRDAHLPELVIRFGATPTSKPLLALLTEASPMQIVVDGDGGWSEPAIIPTTFVHADATGTACELADRIATRRMTTGHGAEVQTAPRWASDWCEADRTADRALLAWLAELESRGEPFEGLPFVVLSRSLPDGAMLWAGNSMPVRDLDDWFTGSSRSLRVLSNRGANGIDGVVSTALGAAAADAGPVTLVVGDVSFLHDLNALVASHLHGLSATIVLVDNDGCGIFSFLPQARTDAAAIGLPAHYEELFGTPHGIDVGPIVTALGGECRVVDGAGLRAALADPVAPAGVRVLHFRTGRARNVEHHRQAAEAVAAALARACAGLSSAICAGKCASAVPDFRSCCCTASWAGGRAGARTPRLWNASSAWSWSIFPATVARGFRPIPRARASSGAPTISPRSSRASTALPLTCSATRSARASRCGWP